MLVRMPVKGVDGNGSDKKDGNERLRHNCVFFFFFWMPAQDARQGT